MGHHDNADETKGTKKEKKKRKKEKQGQNKGDEAIVSCDVNENNDNNVSGDSKRGRRQRGFSLRRLLLSTNPLVTQAQPLFEASPVMMSTKKKKTTTTTKKKSNILNTNSTSPVAETPHTASPTVVRSRKDSHGNTMHECPLCYDWCLDLRSLIGCEHRICSSCMLHYVRIELQECRINIKCPICEAALHPNDMEHSLGREDDGLLRLYESLSLRRILSSDPDARFCPGSNCNYAVIATGCASCPRISCQNPECGIEFCYHCKAHWHPDQTCDSARAQRSHSSHGHSLTVTTSSTVRRSRRRSSSHQSSVGSVEVKVCPKCRIMIVKMDDGSCNHMTCSVCGAEFCWLCMKEISDLHYLSPSGCTFWGKKPWSRKKKLVCQLSTLVFAPVGIALLAGISVPAMLIGIPVWVGRKLHTKYKKSCSRKRRNVIISFGVISSVLVSPFIALFVVGIGVPILLAYVYCVVPVSLCRSQGCGVSTHRRGVKIEVDEEEEDNAHDDVTYTHFRQVSSSSRVANPSIGEVSVGASLSLGSALDGVEANWDRDSASHTAMAGQSLTGSVSGVSAASSFYTRSKLVVELAADVHHLPQPFPHQQGGLSLNENNQMRKKLSLSSERLSTDTTSNVTNNVSNCDSSSTRALAGSMQSNKFVLARLHKQSTSSEYNTCGHQADAISLKSMPAAPSSTETTNIKNSNLRSMSPVEVTDVVVAVGGCPSRKTRLKTTTESKKSYFVERQSSESNSLLTTEDAGSERVRFDDHVDFIDETKENVEHSAEYGCPNKLNGEDDQMDTEKNKEPSSSRSAALPEEKASASSSTWSRAVEPPEEFRTQDL